MSLLRLCCIIEGEKLVFPVDVPAQADVVDLKKAIQSERARGTLQGIDPHILELWKVCILNVNVSDAVHCNFTACLAPRHKCYCRQTS